MWNLVPASWPLVPHVIELFCVPFSIREFEEPKRISNLEEENCRGVGFNLVAFEAGEGCFGS